MIGLKQQWRTGVGALLLASACVLAAKTSFVGQIDDAMLAALEPNGRPDPRVVLVTVGESLLQALGWPLPRDTYAELVEQLKARGARTIAFDILFADSPGEQDERFLAALRSHGHCVLGAQVLFSENGRPLSAEYPRKLLAAATGLGFLNLGLDNTGIYRPAPLWFETREQTLPSLALAAVTAHTGASRRWAEWPKQVDLSYEVDLARFTEISAAELLAQTTPETTLAALRDALVVVGQTAPSLGDFGPTPKGRNTELLRVHAVAVQNLLQHRFLNTAPWPLMLLVTWVLALGLWLRYSLSRTQRIWEPLLALVLVIGSLAISWFLVALFRFWLPVMPLALTVVLTATMLSASRYRQVHVRTLQVTNAFSRYLSASLLKRVLANPESLVVAARRVTATVLFCDIQGYTRLSNHLPAEDLFSFLRMHLRLSTHVITSMDGRIDKIMGDGIMAVFGDPVEDPSHAPHAVAAGLQLQEAFSRMLAQAQHRAYNPEIKSLALRVGIATGDMLAGNIGGEKHIEYTVLGSTVNLASRLEAHAPAGGVLVSEETKQLTLQHFDFSRVTDLHLKGFDVHEAFLVRARKSNAPILMSHEPSNF